MPLVRASTIMFRSMNIRFCALLCLLSAPSLFAQNSFFERWEARATATQAKQPAWTPPLATTYVALIQVARADFTRQIGSTHTTTWNNGLSKGLFLIPFANTEIDINVPPFFAHDTPSVADGFGDASFLLKYRFLTGNAQHGNYVVTGFVLATIPTGSYKNGSTDASVTPTLALGKGFGKLDFQSTLGATLPTGDTSQLGRPILWNTTAQYHHAKIFWPELEVNSTYFHGGPNDGKTQTFLTPGLVVGTFKLHPKDPKSRIGVAFGGGMQIATSQFHSYNHALLFTARLPF
jgi:hypothetical protein